jgi:hypothetical protein
MISKFLRYTSPGILYRTRTALGLVGAVLAQQTGEKVVRAEQAAQITDAVMISNVSVAGNTVECGLFIKPPTVVQPVTPFQAGPDWLQQMTISLVNRTNKTIVFGEILLHFMDTGDCKSLPCARADLHLGQIPAIDAYDGRTGQPLKPENPEMPPLDWKSEQTIVFHVSDYMTQIDQSVENFMSASDVANVNIYRGAFFFGDGMRWQGGRYSVPDPDHHGKFKYLPANYFPGRRGHNWPPGQNN